VTWLRLLLVCLSLCLDHSAHLLDNASLFPPRSSYVYPSSFGHPNISGEAISLHIPLYLLQPCFTTSFSMHGALHYLFIQSLVVFAFAVTTCSLRPETTTEVPDDNSPSRGWRIQLHGRSRLPPFGRK
jgi:hypothetical protein